MVNMRVFLSLLVSIISFSTPPLSANVVSGNVKQSQTRAIQYYVVDRKSQPQVLRDSLWFNDSSWYTISILVYLMVTDQLEECQVL